MSEIPSSGVRRAAYATLIATLLSAIAPMWSATQAAASSGRAASIALAALINCFSVIPLLFFYSLAREEGTLHFPAHMQRWALLAAALLAGLIALTLPNSLRSLNIFVSQLRLLNWQDRSGAIALVVHAPVTWIEVTILTNWILEVALIFLLIALARQPYQEPSPEVPVSPLLKDSARIFVLAYGVWIALNLLRAGAVPFVYAAVFQQAVRANLRPPTYWDLLWEPLRPMLDALPMWLVPYLILNRLGAAPIAPHVTAGTEVPLSDNPAELS